MTHAHSLDPVMELQAINQALLLCESILQEGGRIDLTGVDAQVDRLCEEVVKSEGELRLKLLPLLESAVQSLDRLESGMRTALLAEKEQEEAEKRLRAQSAYAGKTLENPANSENTSRIKSL